jgi:hypothetical protein
VPSLQNCSVERDARQAFIRKPRPSSHEYGSQPSCTTWEQCGIVGGSRRAVGRQLDSNADPAITNVCSNMSTVRTGPPLGCSSPGVLGLAAALSQCSPSWCGGRVPSRLRRARLRSARHGPDLCLPRIVGSDPSWCCAGGFGWYGCDSVRTSNYGHGDTQKRFFQYAYL